MGLEPRCSAKWTVACEVRNRWQITALDFRSFLHPAWVVLGPLTVQPLIGNFQPNWWAYYVLMATVGEVLGGYLTYQISEKGGQETLEKKLGKPRAEKLHKKFEKHGFVTVFGGAILPPPFPFTPVLMAAGTMQYPRRKSLLALSAGRAVRFFIVAYLTKSSPTTMGSLNNSYSWPYSFIWFCCVKPSSFNLSERSACLPVIRSALRNSDSLR